MAKAKTCGNLCYTFGAVIRVLAGLARGGAGVDFAARSDAAKCGQVFAAVPQKR